MVAAVFGGLIAPLFASSIVFRRLSNRSELASALLNASTALYSIIPDPDSFAAKRPLRIEDILNHIEIVSRVTLKCTKCRAFLVSDSVNHAPGTLLSLDGGSGGNEDRMLVGVGCRKTPLGSGIAGFVIATKHVYVMQEDHEDCDRHYNPEVDVAPNGWGLVSGINFV